MSQNHYRLGYEHGYQDGSDQSGHDIEQDFAYKPQSYVDGYWDGWKAGRHVQQMSIHQFDKYLDRLGGTHKQSWFDQDETGYSDND